MATTMFNGRPYTFAPVVVDAMVADSETAARAYALALANWETEWFAGSDAQFQANAYLKALVARIHQEWGEDAGDTILSLGQDMLTGKARLYV